MLIKQPPKQVNPATVPTATPVYTTREDSSDSQVALTGEKSPGVARIEVINRQLTLNDRIALFVGVILIAYAYGLDNTIRATYQTTALASFQHHSLVSTINTVRTVVAAAAQPTAAKIADVVGRVELVYVSILFYVLGTIVQASSTTVSGFCAGAVLYQVGYTTIVLLVLVIVADLTSLRWRLLWTILPDTPDIINTWVSGTIAEKVLAQTTWRWGIGMWAIIYPISAIPLVTALMRASYRSKRAGLMKDYKTPFQQYSVWRTLTGLFWQLDIIGLIFMIAMFALILTPLTLAGGDQQSWRTGHIIAPLVVGVSLIPCFVLYQRWAPHPIIPFHLLKDRAVWGALGIAWMLDFAWYIQGDYLYTVLRVAFGEDVTSATRITQLWTFVSILTAIGLSFVIRFGVPYLKPFIVSGTLLYMVGFGLLIRYRSGTSGRAGIIGTQCLLGFSIALFPYPAQVSIQSAVEHEHVAAVTSVFVALYYIGAAFGTSISGAIWTQTLPKKLSEELGRVTNDSTLATSAYNDPLAFIVDYGFGTPERQAVVRAYDSTQRLLCITGICICIPLIGFALCLRNPRLGKEQGLVKNAEVGYPHRSATGVNNEDASGAGKESA